MAEKEVNKGKAQKGTLDMLLENSIALQKTLAALAADLKSLNQKVSSMLELFEAASKTMREKPSVKTDFAEKVDLLIKQNKTIAKGLLLLEKAIKEKGTAEHETGVQPLPSF